MNKKFEELNLNDEEIKDLLSMRDHFWDEDTATRQSLLQKYRRLKLFWNNISNVWFDSVAHDWRVGNTFDDSISGSSDQAFYDQRINVFRAYLESIFAALSSLVPPVKAYPDDAENASDIETAKAASKIASLIYRHNEADMLWLHNLYIWGTEGLVCGYNYAKYDKKYGTYKLDTYKKVPEIHRVTTCPLCQFELNDELVTEEQLQQEQLIQQQQQLLQQQEQQQLQQGQEQLEQELGSNESIEGQEPTVEQGLEQAAPVDPTMNQDMMGGVMPGMEICPNCQQPMTPQSEVLHSVADKFISTEDIPKGRIHLESYGGLNVKIPLYARKQEECLYLFYCYETHYANAIEMYPDLHDKLNKKSSRRQSGSYDSYEQWARLSTEYKGEYPNNVVTIKSAWFKRSAYNILSEDRSKHWKKKYPDGVSATFIDDLFACAKQEQLDEHWTLEYNPLADYLSNDPLGMLLTSVQEITNDLISLTKQTIEHGVGLTFVDPQVVDLNAYSQTEVVPGALIPTKSISGNKKIGDGFYEIKTATLSGEVMPFGEQIQSLGQLASGAIPSLFGGQIEGSETASQYSMSTNAAKSRLGNTWKTKCNWWKNYIGKGIYMYISIIETDERDVQAREDGSFINIVIKKAELSGKIGRIELAANENLPMNWAQKKDVIMQLLQTPNPNIVQMLMQPENLPILREAIGLDDFYVPGADDVEKQWAEISMLIESQPIPTGDMLNPLMPSVEIDDLVDTHPIHFEIVRKWAVSEVGQYYKYNLPDEYENVLLHGKMHLTALQNSQMAQGMSGEGNPDEQGAPNQEKPKNLNNKDAPITGDTNVPVAP